MLPTRKIRVLPAAKKLPKRCPRVACESCALAPIPFVWPTPRRGFMAIPDACPHQQASLSGGRLNTRLQVICPLHQYSYSLMSGEEGSKRTPAVETFGVESSAEGLFVYLPA